MPWCEWEHRLRLVRCDRVSDDGRKRRQILEVLVQVLIDDDVSVCLDAANPLLGQSSWCTSCNALLAMHFLPCAPCNAPLVLHFLQCTSWNALLEYALHIYITLAMRSLQYIPHNIFTFAAGTFVIICYLCCRYTCHNIFTCVAGTFVWIPGSERHSSGFLCHLSQRRTHPADGTSSGLLDIQDVRFLTCSGVYTCIPVLRLKNPLSYQCGQNTKNWKLKTVW